MAWTPADHWESRKFLLPVYDPACDGTFPVAGETVRVLVNSDDGVLKAMDMVIIGISDDHKTIYWECDATNLFKRSADVFAVHSQHNCPCPAAVNLRIIGLDIGDNTVDGFTIGTIDTTGDWDPAVPGDEVLLEDAMNAVLLGNGHATVTTDGTEFTIYVMNTTYDVSVLNVVTDTPLVAF